MTIMMKLIAFSFITGALLVFREEKILAVLSLVGGNIVFALALILEKLEKIEKGKR